MSTRPKRSRTPSDKAVENLSAVPKKRWKANVKTKQGSSSGSTSTSTNKPGSQQVIDASMEERIVTQVTEKLVPVLTEKLRANLLDKAKVVDEEDDEGESSEEDELEELRSAALNTMGTSV